MNHRNALAFLLRAGALLAMLAPLAAAAGDAPAFVPQLVNSSTVPVNGDVNPYGVAFVPPGFPTGGTINTGDVLVSNFNGSANTQGTGTTIVQLTPAATLAAPGMATVFFTSSQPGLTTALGVLRAGFVLVGNVPTTNGNFNTIGPGTLQVIDRHGALLDTWSDPAFLDGPWDLTIDDQGATARVFVSNVLNGTVSRLDVAVGATNVTVLKKTTIAQGYTHVPNAAALVLGPTGLAYDAQTDTLFVASTADNAIYAIANAAHAANAVNRGALTFSDPHLRGPLALRFAPGGNLLAANGDAVNADAAHPSEVIEFTQQGRFVREYNVDASQGGAFGMDTVLSEGNTGFNYAVVDNITNSLSVYRLPVQ